MSCDAVCICLRSFANRIAPIAMPTKKNREERDADEALVSWGCRTDTPQLLVQQFLVTLIHR